jgi:hypothetical protein
MQRNCFCAECFAKPRFYLELPSQTGQVGPPERHPLEHAREPGQVSFDDETQIKFIFKTRQLSRIYT